MKKAIQLFFLGVLFFALTGNAQNKVKGNGKIISEKRTTTEYDEIKVSGSFDIVLVSGNEGAITIEGEENLLPYVKTEVSGKVLKIFSDKNIKSSNKSNIVLTVPVDKISVLSLSGSGDISTKSSIAVPDLKVKLSGDGDLTLDIQTSDFEVNLSGSGDIVLKGETDNFVAKTSGSGDVNAIDLVAKKVNISISGSGDMKVNCTENLVARVSGSGDIQYKGNPKTNDTKVSGSGNISKI